MTLSYAENASKLHRAFGAFLEVNGYAGYTIIQEANVKKLCPTHSNHQDRFDYYIPELSLVVELHGEQHFKPVRFGNISENKATNNYVSRVSKDSEKYLSSLRHRYIYITFSCEKEMTPEEMNNKIEQSELDMADYDYENDPILREYEDAIEKELEKKRLLSERRKSFGRKRDNDNYNYRPRRSNNEGE